MIQQNIKLTSRELTLEMNEEVKEIAMAEYRGEWCVGVVYSDDVYGVINSGEKFSCRDEATDYAHSLSKKFHLGIFVYPEDS